MGPEMKDQEMAERPEESAGAAEAGARGEEEAGRSGTEAEAPAAPAAAASAAATPGAAPVSLFDKGDAQPMRPETLKMYYKWLFPVKEMHQWLSYGHDTKAPGSDQGTRFFQKREFCFTMDEMFNRWRSFRDAQDLRQGLVKDTPSKIDLGAVYSMNPATKSHHQGTERFVALERELVFDIDMTDYDDIRTCCEGAKVCDRCWTFMTVAIKVIDKMLREDYGFEHLLWVFSGRRGVHCWVCDSRARKLTDDQRGAIVNYFRVYIGTENSSQKVNFTGAPLHPTLMRAYEEVLIPFFETHILPDQALLQDEAAWNKMLANVPDEELRDRLVDKWRSDRRGSEEAANLPRWQQLEAAIRQGAKKNHALRRTVEEIVFGYSYPRLDIEVSRKRNHLLKAPFCVHPKTGKVCVPIDPATCESFSPDAVPTLHQLMEELNQGGAKGDSPDVKVTTLEKHIEFFRTHFLEKLLDTCKVELSATQKLKARSQLVEGSTDW